MPLGTQWSVHNAQRWLAGCVDLGLDLELVLVLFLKGSQGVAPGRSRALLFALGALFFPFFFNRFPSL